MQSLLYSSFWESVQESVVEGKSIMYDNETITEDEVIRLQLLKTCVAYRRRLYQSVGAEPGPRLRRDEVEIGSLEARIASKT